MPLKCFIVSTLLYPKSSVEKSFLDKFLPASHQKNRERWGKFKGLKLSLPTQPDSSHRCRNPNRVTFIICALELWTSLAEDGGSKAEECIAYL